MQARFYDPLLGRFLSADTIVPEPGNPQSLNRYSYVYNSPLMYNDPTGHQGGFGGNLGVGFCMDIDCTSDPNIIAAVESACHADYASCMPFVEYLPPISKPPPPDPADYEIFGSYQAYFDDWQRSVEAYLGPHPGPNVEALRMVGEVLIGLTPLDTPFSIAGVLAGRSCTGGSASRAWSALGLLPFVSGSLDDVADVARAGRAAHEVTKAASPVWKNTKPWRGPIRTNAESGKARQFFTWDHTHREIEVWDRNGKHLGAIDPVTGEHRKPPVRGRTINVR